MQDFLFFLLFLERLITDTFICMFTAWTSCLRCDKGSICVCFDVWFIADVLSACSKISTNARYGILMALVEIWRSLVAKIFHGQHKKLKNSLFWAIQCVVFFRFFWRNLKSSFQYFCMKLMERNLNDTTVTFKIIYRIKALVLVLMH